MSRRSALIIAAAILLVIAGVAFHQRQGSGALGGAISLPKQLWLCYTLFAWFVLPAVFAASRDIAPLLRRAYTVHLCYWGARAVIELWLLYVTVSWTPIYGIAHDLGAMVLLSFWISRSGSVHVGREDRAGAPPSPATAPPIVATAWSSFARHWLKAIRLALVPEILFAAWFRQANGGRAGIYFADDSARFAQINLVTTIVVAVVYLHLGWCMLRFGQNRTGREVIGAAR